MPTEDYAAQTEAWIRKKPKRIIQNQKLIEMLPFILIYTAGIGMLVVLHLISIFPLTMTFIIGTWAITVPIYIAYHIHLERFEIKYRNNLK